MKMGLWEWGHARVSASLAERAAAMWTSQEWNITKVEVKIRLFLTQGSLQSFYQGSLHLNVHSFLHPQCPIIYLFVAPVYKHLPSHKKRRDNNFSFLTIMYITKPLPFIYSNIYVEPEGIPCCRGCTVSRPAKQPLKVTGLFNFACLNCANATNIQWKWWAEDGQMLANTSWKLNKIKVNYTICKTLESLWSACPFNNLQYIHLSPPSFLHQPPTPTPTPRLCPCKCSCLFDCPPSAWVSIRMCTQ